MIFEDFRVSADPSTAQRRADHFRCREDVVDEVIRIRTLLGQDVPQDLQDYSLFLGDSRRFAEKQLRQMAILAAGEVKP